MYRNIAISVFILGLGIGAYFLRSPAESHHDLKSLSLKMKDQLIVKTAKLQPPYSISIFNPTALPAQANEPFTLVADISSTEDAPGLSYAWILPEGVLPYGNEPLSGTISKVSPRSSAKLTLQLVQLDSEINRKIHLKIWRIEDQNSALASAQYNTLEQNDIDQKKLELGIRNKEYILDQNVGLKAHR